MGRQKLLPSHCLKVQTYGELRSVVKAFAAGIYDSTCVLGGPGLGKSEMIKRTMQEATGTDGWGLITGKHTPLDLYQQLHRYRSVPIVLDDLDDLLRKPDNVVMLKCLCDTHPVKLLEWGSNHAAFNSDLPKSFESISRACLISNDWNALDRNIGALYDCGVVLHFQPSAVELHREVAEAGLVRRPGGLRFHRKIPLYLIAEPSFRFYLAAAAHKRAELDWRNVILRSIENALDPKLLLVAQLLENSEYDAAPSPERTRVAMFRQRGGGSKATYYRCKEELLQRRGAIAPDTLERIKLGSPKVDLHYQAMLDRRDHIARLHKEQTDGSAPKGGQQ